MLLDINNISGEAFISFNIFPIPVWNFKNNPGSGLTSVILVKKKKCKRNWWSVISRNQNLQPTKTKNFQVTSEIFFVRTSGKMDSFLCKYQYLKYQITFFSCPRCVNVIIYVGIHSFFHKKYFKKHRGSKSAKIKNKLRTISASESIAQGKI